ncbi:MAG: zinc ribbon domain-containing protein [Deltaproteobacteria bacterium]|nr:zinc ribbon domain-containing protein [Deltaproteobacteria bacterium]
MPIFEFTCEKCRADFEEYINHSEIGKVKCGQCGSAKVIRRLSVIGGIKVKGGASQACPSAKDCPSQGPCCSTGCCPMDV